MNKTPTTYPTNGREAILSNRDVKLLLRIKQILNQRGEGAHTFTLIVRNDGLWELIPPPPEAERIG